MKVLVNGESNEVGDDITVLALLAGLGLEGKRVAVAVNRDVVIRAEHGRRVLQDGDRIEIVQAVQGG